MAKTIVEIDIKSQGILRVDKITNDSYRVTSNDEDRHGVLDGTAVIRLLGHYLHGVDAKGFGEGK